MSNEDENMINCSIATCTTGFIAARDERKQNVVLMTKAVITFTIGLNAALLILWIITCQVSTFQLFNKNLYMVAISDVGLETTATTRLMEHDFSRSSPSTLYQIHHNNDNSTVGSRIWPACQFESYAITEPKVSGSIIDDEDTSPQSYLIYLDDLQFQIQFLDVEDTKKSYSNTVSYDIMKAAQDRFLKSFERFVPDTTIPSNRDKCVPISTMQMDRNHNNNSTHQTIEYEQITKIHYVISSSDSTLFHGVDESYKISIPTNDNSFEFNKHRSHSTTENDTKETIRKKYRRSMATQDHSIFISSQTIYGALRSLQTIKQLLIYGGCISDTKQCQKYTHYFYINDIPIEIIDYPDYKFRGLMIDTARHYFPLSFILQNLDAMEFNKLNVLHWHMTDTQSWPYTSDIYPELSDHGAFCPLCTYTSNDVKVITKEAHYRGIRLIMEYDLPGHSLSIGNSHPEFLTNCSNQLAEPLDVTKDSVMTFIDTLYKEILSLYDFNDNNNGISTLLDIQQANDAQQHWIHIGGDEVPTQCWDDSESVKEYMRQYNISNGKELLYIFELNLLETVKKLNLRPIVWQELYNPDKPLPSNTIIDVWQSTGQELLRNATNQGYDVVSSFCYYMDHLNVDWQGIYDCDFLGNVTTKEQKQHILGGHGCMWAERIDPGNFFPTVYPRTSAMAERLWNTGIGNSQTKGVFERLKRFRCLLVRHLNIAAAPIYPDDCSVIN
jgi:hexosaminidase